MKFRIFLLILIGFLISISSAFAIMTYNCTDFTGGGSRDLDHYTITSLNNNDIAYVRKSGKVYTFYFNASSSVEENISSHPYAVRPNDYGSGPGVWIEFIIPYTSMIADNQSPQSDSVCTAGTIVYDSNYIYICTESAVWKRATLTGY